MKDVVASRLREIQGLIGRSDDVVLSGKRVPNGLTPDYPERISRGEEAWIVLAGKLRIALIAY